MKRLFQRRRVMALGMLSAAAISLAGFTALPQASSAATPRSSSHYGGVLYMLGTGDVDYFDPNITYYTVGYLGVRIWTETLLAYPAIPARRSRSRRNSRPRCRPCPMAALCTRSRSARVWSGTRLRRVR